MANKTKYKNISDTVLAQESDDEIYGTIIINGKPVIYETTKTEEKTELLKSDKIGDEELDKFVEVFESNERKLKRLENRILKNDKQYKIMSTFLGSGTGYYNLDRKEIAKLSRTEAMKELYDKMTKIIEQKKKLRSLVKLLHNVKKTQEKKHNMHMTFRPKTDGSMLGSVLYDNQGRPYLFGA